LPPPGRKPGSKNKTTLVAEALLRDEEEELVRKAIEMAKTGDGPMLKFLLDRILPKERSVGIEVELPDGALDPVEAMRAIVDAAVTGRIAPAEASALGDVVAGYTRVRDIVEYGERLAQIERDMRALKETT
jgi:hypothetical protein